LSLTVEIKLIWAQARNRVIGKDGGMPWHLPEDLAHLKAKTMGCPVIMGRRTWDSLPPRFRPLPGRHNIVLTRDSAWQPGASVQPQNSSQTGQQSARGAHEALLICEQMSPRPETVWVIGGAQIYAQFLPFAHGAEVTEIEADLDGDTFAPAIPSHWMETARSRHTAVNGLNYSFVSYRATPKSAPNP
jgi:dihydrofolate reductase